MLFGSLESIPATAIRAELVATPVEQHRQTKIGNANGIARSIGYKYISLRLELASIFHTVSSIESLTLCRSPWAIPSL